jgi:hypothetical protein
MIISDGKGIASLTQFTGKTSRLKNEGKKITRGIYHCILLSALVFFLQNFCNKIQEQLLWIFIKYRNQNRALVQLHRLRHHSTFTVPPFLSRNQNANL